MTVKFACKEKTPGEPTAPKTINLPSVFIDIATLGYRIYWHKILPADVSPEFITFKPHWKFSGYTCITVPFCEYAGMSIREVQAIQFGQSMDMREEQNQK